MEKIMKNTCILILLAAGSCLNAFGDETPAAGSTAMPTQSTSPSPEQTRFGAGVVIGEPTGPTVKYWLNDVLALDGTVGWSLRDDDNVYLNADLLWHKLDLIPVTNGSTAAYIGVGPSIEFRREEDNRFGVRVPLGLTYRPNNRPLDVFVEFAPILDAAPNVHGDFNAGIGLRYWF